MEHRRWLSVRADFKLLSFQRRNAMTAVAFPTSQPSGFHSPPSKILQLLELRAFSEFAASLALLPLLRTAPRGDGHPVLVLPGLIASDTSTVPSPSSFSTELAVSSRTPVKRCEFLIESLRQRATAQIAGWSSRVPSPS